VKQENTSAERNSTEQPINLQKDGKRFSLEEHELRCLKKEGTSRKGSGKYQMGGRG